MPNKKCEATLTYDIHRISVFTNQGVNQGKHRHQPFQKLAQIFVDLNRNISDMVRNKRPIVPEKRN